MGKFDGILLASDLDGTLNNRNHVISPENRDAISYFQSQGGRFTLATGRSPQGLDAPLDVIRCNAPLILSNGGVIVHHETGQILWEAFMSADSRDFCRKAKTAFPHIALEIHKPDGVWVFDCNELSRFHLNIVKITPLEGYSLDQTPDPWRKALFLGQPEELNQLLSWSQTQDLSPFSFCFSNPFMLEMQAANVSKGTGVSFVADWLGIAHNHVYCVGDEHNDLPMLTRFHGYAPANASPDVRKVVANHLPHCNHHAIAALVKRIDCASL